MLRQNLRRGRLTVGLAPITILALTFVVAGCARVPIEHADGVGECGGQAVAIAADQNTIGDELSLTVSGPEGVSLVFGQGWLAPDASAAEDSDPAMSTLYAESLGSSASDESGESTARFAFLTALTPDPARGWTDATVDGIRTVSFEGTLADLVGDEPTALDAFGGLFLDSSEKTFVPGFVGVACDAAVATGMYEGDLVTGTVRDLSFTAAAPVFPNSVSIDSLETLDEQEVGPLMETTFAFPASSAREFGDFEPLYVNAVSVFADDPAVPNDSLESLWAQYCSQHFTPDAISTEPFPSADIVDPAISDGHFSASLFAGGDPTAGIPGAPAGDYLALMFVSDRDFSRVGLGEGEIPWGAMKAVFTSFHFTPSTGSWETEPPGPELAATGPADGAMAAAVLAMVALAVGCALIIARRMMHSRRSGTGRAIGR